MNLDLSRTRATSTPHRADGPDGLRRLRDRLSKADSMQPGDPVRQVWHGLGALLFFSVTAVLGYVFLCGWSFGEAFYMLLVTISTVGYGEIRHDSVLDRWVNVYLIVFGISAAAYAFGGLLQLMAEGQIRRIVGQRSQDHKIHALENHNIICGFGRMGALICEDLYRREAPFVLVDSDADRVDIAATAGYLYVQGDANDEETLRRAGVERARSLVAVLSSDADNVFVTLTARQMNAKLFITARAEKSSSEKKLVHAGADRVVSPQAIGASRILNLLTRPTTVEIVEMVTGRHSVDLEMNELELPVGGKIHGQTLAQAQVRAKTGVIVVAIKRQDGTLIINPNSDVVINERDTVVILGRRENVDAFRREFATQA